MHRSIYGRCEFGPCNDCPHYSPPFRGHYQRHSPLVRSHRRPSLPRAGVTVFGGDRMGVQLVVNQSAFSCGCIPDRVLPVLHVRPMDRVPSPSLSRSRSRSISPVISIIGSIPSGFSGPGSVSSGYSYRTLYPQNIPPPMMVSRSLRGTLNSLSGIFSGYDRSLCELSHWRSWYDSSH